MADARVGDHAVAASEFADGCSSYFYASVDNTIRTLKGSSGRLYGVEISNPNTTDVWVQFFDVSMAVLGSTTPTFSLFVPKGSASGRGARTEIFVVPLQFDNVIKYAAATTPAGSTNPASALTMNAWYR